MNTKTIVIILGIGVVILGGFSFLLLSKEQKKPNVAVDNNANTNNKNSTDKTLNMAISFDNKGFTPQEVKVALNGNVSITNATKAPLIIKYDDTSLPATLVLPNSSTKSPNFVRKGTYKYTATGKDTFSGVIIVE